MNDTPNHHGRAQCSHVGAQKGDLMIVKTESGYEAHGRLYLLGSDVGPIVGKGATEEEARNDLERQLHEASDSLWA